MSPEKASSSETTEKMDSLNFDDQDEMDIKERKLTKLKKSKNALKRLRDGKSSKKHDRNFDVSAFLDTEAMEDDEDEDYDYEEGILDLSKESAEAERVEQRRLRMETLTKDGRDRKRAGGAAHLETAIESLTKRYQDLPETEGADEVAEEQLFDMPIYDDVTESTSFLPDLSDPKLWLVKLSKGGLARELAISIQNKFLTLKRSGIDLGIFSSFASDTLTNYLYVEADNKRDVIDALTGLRNVYINSVKMVPLSEMPSVFNVVLSDASIPRNDEYVRVRTGLYKGDLGQVFEVDVNNGRVTLRLIPRIEMPSDQYQTSTQSEAVNNSAINGLGGSKRPPKRFFNRLEVEEAGGFLEVGFYPGTVRYNNHTFEDSGHILFRISLKGIITGPQVEATLKELKEFNQHRNVSFDQEALKVTKSRRTLGLYKLGERVKVIKGELTNLKGKIIGVSTNHVKVDTEEAGIDSFDVPWGDFVKHFEEGDSVRVISGINTGETGLISLVDLSNRSAVVFSPLSGQEFRCSLENLSLTKSEGSGGQKLLSLNGYTIGDLVQLTNGTIGVLVYIDKNRIAKFINVNSQLIVGNLSQILCKRNNADQVTKDANMASIGCKSNVIISKGSLKGKNAIVLHIWQSWVFVMLSDYARGKTGAAHQYVTETSVTCLEGEDVICLNPQANQSSSHNNSSNNKQLNNNNTMRGASRYINPFVGKTVKILVGRYKGLLADIVKVEPDQFTVLLKVKPQTMRYKKAECLVIDSIGSNINGGFERTHHSRFSNKPTSHTHNTFNHDDRHKGENSHHQPISKISSDSSHNALFTLKYAKGTVVEITGAGAYQGRTGIVGETISGSRETDLTILHLFVDDDYIAIASESVKPKIPSEVNQQVIIMQNGNNMNKIGTLIQLDGTMGVVESGSEYLSVPVEQLCLYVPV